MSTNDFTNVRLIDRLKDWRKLWPTSVREDSNKFIDPDLPDSDITQVRKQMLACLENRGGEVMAHKRAALLGQTYLGLNETGRLKFLTIIASEFGTNTVAVNTAISKVQVASTPVERTSAEQDLRKVLEAQRVKLLTQFNAIPEGVKFLVDLRAELITMLHVEPLLTLLEADLRTLLVAWFDLGFLELVRVTWHSPAALLEKIITYEAVHAIKSWDDLKNRLDSDRRLYAFLHPRMPDEPLIFVQVALVRGMADNVQAVLDESAPVLDPKDADTAIFYSISNAQRGLDGISLGNFLIKRVVDSLAHEFPDLRTFATLSPIPGFRKWLEEKLKSGEPGLLTASEHRSLKVMTGVGAKGGFKLLLNRDDWFTDESIVSTLKNPLIRLCARYLAIEKQKGHGGKTITPRTLDSVAHFHLSNGARMERLNWLADCSEKGIRQSAGIMINYLYKISEIDRNHEAYKAHGKVTLSSQIRNLIKS